MSDSEKPDVPASAPQPSAPPPGETPSLPAPSSATPEGSAAEAPKEQPGKQYRAAWQARSQAKAAPSKPGQRPEAKPRREPEPKPVAAPPPRPHAEKPRLRDLDAQIDQEFQEMMGGLSEKELFGEKPKAPAQQEAEAEPGRKKGRVLAVHGNDVFVDVPGGRTQGILPLLQFEEGPPAVGSDVDVHIEGYDAANGLLILSRLGAAVHVDWSSVATGMIVEARVTATNKGGLSVEVNGIRGFMPISQIDLYRVENAEQFVNQRLRCLVTDVNPEEKNLVVSRRALLEKEREESREKLWQELAEGQTREGIVRSVKDFGAFIDLGGVDGLLHVSQMSWSRVENASQIVQLGQKIKVQILKIDPETRKLSLGLKQLLASPWDSVGLNYPEGSIAKGKVTKLMEFGAFVELEPGIEGLVHISELAPQRVRRVNEVVQVGQEVKVAVLSIDRDQKRISLSIKAALPQEMNDTAEEGEEDLPLKPPRPPTTPLRGGIGSE
ncbi:MAG TPA: S1 RNA-binding domain-containing protein [Gemmataceae bacterium]|nr:S1 RNA-binding domain-containing protein [Gemmataceae bacterium]